MYSEFIDSCNLIKVVWADVFAFETLCIKYIQQVKKALRIDSIYTTSSSWFNEYAQVDILIDCIDNLMPTQFYIRIDRQF